MSKYVVALGAGRGVDVMLARQSLLNCAAFDGFGGGCDGGVSCLARPHLPPLALRK